MLLTITTTHKPATDLGFLLYKHPDHLKSYDLSCGKAHVFYPQADEDKCTVAVLLDIDPIALAKNSRNFSGNFALAQYVNDRPYVLSSFMSVALTKAFSTAMGGRCKNRPELVDEALPFTVTLSSVPAKGGEFIIEQLFAPLGYEIEVERHVLDEKFPDWGMSKYYKVTLTNTLKLQDLLTHLYVLLPVMDNDKHYYTGENEVQVLLDKGKTWLKDHPAKTLITNRYLRNLKSYARMAMRELNDESIDDEKELPQISPELKEKKVSLNKQRLQVVTEQLLKINARSVIDFGCGEGKLIRELLKKPQFSKILGIDVSYNELLKAKDRMHWDRMPDKKRERVELVQGSLQYCDERTLDFDAAAIIEVIEHMDADRLNSFEQIVFSYSQPVHVIITTPNSEYNVLYEGMKPGALRHNDHRFEWTRKEFKTWADKVANNHHYSVVFYGIGDEDEKLGTPTQMAVFTKQSLPDSQED